MSAESRGHLDRSTQRRFKWILLSVVAILVLVLTPLMLSADLRLDLAHRFNLVPGRDVEKIAGGDDGTTLVVAHIRTTTDAGREEHRFRAAFLAHSGPAGVEITLIDSGERIALPLEAYDFYSNSLDGSQVLVQDTRDPDNLRGALVNLDTGQVTEMPAEEPFPTDIPGDWTTASSDSWIGRCGGVSPHAKFITCFKDPNMSSYLAGDWELQVLVYGNANQVESVYRGRGLRPIGGWSNDDSRLYFQNDEGIWMANISPEIFP